MSDIGVIAQAVSFCKLPGRWAFAPTGSMIINDQHVACEVGELHYNHPTYKLRFCIKMGEWAFVLERNTEVDVMLVEMLSGGKVRNYTPGKLAISAFHHNDYYMLGWITPGTQEVNTAFINTVLARFFPILYPRARQEDPPRFKVETYTRGE